MVDHFKHTTAPFDLLITAVIYGLSRYTNFVVIISLASTLEAGRNIFQSNVTSASAAILLLLFGESVTILFLVIIVSVMKKLLNLSFGSLRKLTVEYLNYFLSSSSLI